LDQANTNSQNRLQVSPPSAIQAITNKNGDFFDSIVHTRTSPDGPIDSRG
jgi:hypothetical protein